MRQTDFGGMLGSALGSVRGSVLGFGCGSVLGRVGRSASLRAMECAWEEGITVFDTARSYGFGEAEGVLAEFLRGKREQAVVMTKFGILPQRQSALTKAAMPVVRAAMKVPGASEGSEDDAWGWSRCRAWGVYCARVASFAGGEFAAASDGVCGCAFPA